MSGGPRLRQDDHLSALQPGARLHTYTIGAILGAGGFGITYKAREDITNRDVAIKEYLPTAFAVRDRDGATVRPLSEGAARDFEWGLERFREEAKLLISFRHPNIVPVLAYFEANGTGYLVMAFQDGASLGEALRNAPTLSQAQVLQFMVPLLDGVENVHRHNFLHRDIKPENIFIRSDGTPVLLDFGAARQALGEHSKAFTTLLTEGYAPFEQYAGTGNQGPWSDIYALAAVMFRCLAGKSPVEAPRRAVAKLRGIADPMAQDFAELRNRVSSDLAFAIEAAMRVVEQERPQSIAAFRELIVSPAPAAIRLPAAAAAPPASAATLIPDAAQGETPRHLPPWYAAERRKPRRTARYVVFGGVMLAAASGAAYVGDQRNWLPEAFRRAGSEVTAPVPAQAAPPELGRRPADDANRPADDAKRPADEAKRQADEAKRKAEEEERRNAEDRSRAEHREVEERRNKAFADYQRQQLEQFEAERRQIEARRAAPAEPRAAQEPRREVETSPADQAEPRRDAVPTAPPAARRSPPPGDAQRYPPQSPPARGQVPRGWNDPNYEDDY